MTVNITGLMSLNNDNVTMVSKSKSRRLSVAPTSLMQLNATR